ncbi:MAG: hypothetical protein H3Z51_02465 [archaeon]|nr:hypothetical protein [archaeon]
MDVKTFTSEDGKRKYIVFRTPAKKAAERAYHVFMEVEAKNAAIDCGSKLPRNVATPVHWDKMWEK